MFRTSQADANGLETSYADLDLQGQRQRKQTQLQIPPGEGKNEDLTVRTWRGTRTETKGSPAALAAEMPIVRHGQCAKHMLNNVPVAGVVSHGGSV